MIDRELDIIRYVDDALTATERSGFEAERASDEMLRSEVSTEQTIQHSLREDGDRLEREFATVPGAPLFTQLGPTSEASADNRVIYYVLGAVTLIILWLFFSLVRSHPTDTPATVPPAVPSGAQHPATQSTPTDVATPPSIQAPPVAEPRAKPETKSSVKQQQPETIDLDKGLDKPKIFDDPKAHMPLEKK
jgi:hypothetical protein